MSVTPIERRYVWVPLLFSAAIRAVYGALYWRTIPYARAPVVDAEIYADLARQLRAGLWLNPELLYHSFLYPYFLALFPFTGDAFYLAVIVAQLALGVLDTWLVMDIARRVWGTRWSVSLAGIGFTVTIPIAFYETKIYSEALSLTLLVVLLWQMASRRSPWAVGVTCGLLCLARAEALLFIPIVAYWAWKVDRPGSAVARVGGALVAALFWIGLASLRNTLIAGVLVPTPTTMSGLSFYIGNNESAAGVYSQPEGFDSSILAQNVQAKELAEKALGRPLDPMAVSRYWSGRAWSYLAENPRRALELAALKLKVYFDVREVLLDLGFYAEREQLPLLRLLVLPFPALLLLALVGFFDARRSPERRLMGQCLAAALLPSLIVSLVFFAQSRFRVTALAPALILAAHGTQALVSRATLGAGAVLALAVSMTVLAQLADDTPKDRAVSQYNLGIAYERLGADGEALSHFERAFTVAAPHAMVRSKYAASLARSGRPAEGEAVLRDGLRLDPRSVALLVDLGHLEFVRQRLDEADRLFREALRWDPDNTVAKLNTAIILRTRTRDPVALAEAARSFREIADSGDLRYARHALLNLGITQALMGESAMVDPTYERAARLRPLSSGEEHDWAVALLTIGRTEDARDHVLRALEIDPNDQNAKRLLRVVEQRLNQKIR